ncbi:ectomycorrhizas-regulated small secreted protein [Ephemerocybe angulata]|uniref:Ectomycorrhizas-regulated small secreted protein n=1 Tax=Ephemerocybe angulata TaxID=980116 RepID=A0A8H6M159_9AGAR|nr:ectomycorrhizas-regulated small secreted protein [Tulosesus angulatus]
MRVSSIYALVPLALSLASLTVAKDVASSVDAREYIDELATRELLSELSTRDLIEELSDRLERRTITQCAYCGKKKVVKGAPCENHSGGHF